MPLSLSTARLSDCEVPLSTLPGLLMAPLLYRNISVMEVFPASTWATIPILIVFLVMDIVYYPNLGAKVISNQSCKKSEGDL